MRDAACHAEVMTRLWIAALLCFSMSLPAHAQQGQGPPTSPAEAPLTLDRMRGRYRPLVVFQPGKDEGLDDQLNLLTEYRSDLIARQVMLVLRPYAWAGVVDNRILTFRSWEEDQDLRRRFGVRDNEFTVILIGKDGTEKQRWHKPLTIDELRDAVDKMPMRQEEMRERKRKP